MVVGVGPLQLCARRWDAFSVATQERQTQAAEILPGLKKQWRRSGKVHSRTAHDLADGQIVDVDKPFMVGGVPLMYPRDPKAPAKETINCGCVSDFHIWSIGKFASQTDCRFPMRKWPESNQVGSGS